MCALHQQRESQYAYFTSELFLLFFCHHSKSKWSYEAIPSTHVLNNVHSPNLYVHLLHSDTDGCMLALLKLRSDCMHYACDALYCAS